MIIIRIEKNVGRILKTVVGVKLIYIGTTLQYEIIKNNSNNKPKIEHKLFQPKIYTLPYYQFKTEKPVKYYNV